MAAIALSLGACGGGAVGGGPAEKTRYAITLEEGEVAEHDAQGSCWRADCTAPDLVARVYVSGAIAGETDIESGVYRARFDRAYVVALPSIDALVLGLYDVGAGAERAAVECTYLAIDEGDLRDLAERLRTGDLGCTQAGNSIRARIESLKRQRM